MLHSTFAFMMLVFRKCKFRGRAKETDRALNVVGKLASNQTSAREPGAGCLIRHSIRRTPSNGVDGTSSPDTRHHHRK